MRNLVLDKRLWQHVPVGVINVGLFVVNSDLALLFGAGFVAYEIVQGSKPHKDIIGWLWGLAMAAPIVWYFG